MQYSYVTILYSEQLLCGYCIAMNLVSWDFVSFVQRPSHSWPGSRIYLFIFRKLFKLIFAIECLVSRPKITQQRSPYVNRMVSYDRNENIIESILHQKYCGINLTPHPNLHMQTFVNLWCTMCAMMCGIAVSKSIRKKKVRKREKSIPKDTWQMAMLMYMCFECCGLRN